MRRIASHPLNLTLRFLLEVAALAAMALWGWQHGSEWGQYGLAIGVPSAAVLLWGVFAVPNDPSRGGTAPVPVPGVVRVALEFALFGFAGWALFDKGATTLGWSFAAAVALHCVVSVERLVWLMGK